MNDCTSIIICVQVSLSFWETCSHLLVVSPGNKNIERKWFQLVGTVDVWLGMPVKVPFTSVSGAIVTGWDDGPSSTAIFIFCSLASWLMTTGRACVPDIPCRGRLSGEWQRVSIGPPCLSCLGDGAPEINSVVYRCYFFIPDYSWPKMYILMILVVILYGMTD